MAWYMVRSVERKGCVGMNAIVRTIEGMMCGLDGKAIKCTVGSKDADLLYDLIDRCQRLTHEYQKGLDCNGCDGTLREHEKGCRM